MSVPVEEIVATVSPSKLDMFQRCGFAFFCRYVEGIRTPPTAALAFGSAFDDAANEGATEKIIREETPAPEMVAELFDAAWSRRRESVEDWKDEDPAKMLDQGTALAATWTRRFLSSVRPLETQPALTVELEESNGDRWKAIGYGDLLAVVELEGLPPVPVIVDQKTSARRWTVGRLQTSTQAAFYVEALRRRAPESSEVDRAVWCVGVRKSSPEIQVLARRVGPQERAGVISRFGAARAAIRALYSSGAWLPNRQNALCSRRWCAYWNRCQTTWGGRVPD